MANDTDTVQYQSLAEPIALAPLGGGGWSGPVSRDTLQYQEIAEPFDTRSTVVETGALESVIVIDGISLDYPSITEPVAVPPGVTPFDPQTAEFLTAFPNPPLRLTLPEMGGFFMPTLVPQVSGSALSWVPVYYGLDSLRRITALFPFSQVMNPPFVSSLTKPNQWTAYYPDTTRRQPDGFPATLPALTWTVINITPPPPPTAHLNPFPNLYRRWFLFDMRRP